MYFVRKIYEIKERNQKNMRNRRYRNNRHPDVQTGSTEKNLAIRWAIPTLHSVKQ